MSDHDLFAPSKMARIVQCPGSAVYALGFPEAEIPEAAEGTAAHWVLSEAASGRKHPGGTLAPNGVSVDDDMIDGADMALDVIRSWGAPAAIEKRMRITRIHPEHCGGTPDARGRVMPVSRNRKSVLDFKYGHGFVEAFGNLQLAAYAAGEFDPECDNDVTIFDLTIVQPRNYHRDGPVRTWSTTVAGLAPYWDRMAEACKRALEPLPPFSVGPECKYCPARHACPALQTSALNSCDVVETAAPLELPIEAAARELVMLQRAGELLDARISGLKTQVTDACRRGEQVPYFHLESSASTLQWSAPLEQVKALGDLLGVTVTKEILITPTQARKAGLPNEAISGFASRPPGAVKLTLLGNKAAKIFTKDS